MSTDTQEMELAQAASRLTQQDLAWIEENTQEVSSQEESSQEASSQEESSQEVSSQETSSQEESSQETGSGTMFNSGSEQKKPKNRKRRRVKHTWPEVGTILEADYEGTRYEAEVVPAVKYKSGKAVKILSGPAAGKVKSSMSGAMNLATKRQREDNNLGSKGVSNGWEFWKPRK